jgi:hypothetical protein
MVMRSKHYFESSVLNFIIESFTQLVTTSLSLRLIDPYNSGKNCYKVPWRLFAYSAVSVHANHHVAPPSVFPRTR